MEAKRIVAHCFEWWNVGPVTRAIPLWKATLTALDRGFFHQHRRIKHDKIEYDSDMEEGRMAHELKRRPSDDDWLRKFRIEKWMRENCTLKQSEPNLLWTEKEEVPHYISTGRLCCDGLQAIVKLANVELTPKKPGYPGGSWHVEGALVTSEIISSKRFAHLHPRMSTYVLQHCTITKVITSRAATLPSANNQTAGKSNRYHINRMTTNSLGQYSVWTHEALQSRL